MFAAATTAVVAFAMDLKGRIREAMRLGGFTRDEDLALAISKLTGTDVPQQTIQSLRSGRSKTSVYLPHIAHLCGVSAIWLAAGIGEKRVTSDGPRWPFAVPFYKFEQLDDRQREQLEGAVAGLIHSFDVVPHPARPKRRKTG